MTFEKFPFVYLIQFSPLVIGLMVYGAKTKSKMLSQFVDLSQIKRLIPDYSFTTHVIKQALIVVAIALVIIGLMRPQYGISFKPQSVKGWIL